MIKTLRYYRVFQTALLATTFIYTINVWAGSQHKNLILAESLPNEATNKQELNIQKNTILPLDDLRIFTEVLQRIKALYVEKVDDKTLLESAINGMLNDLDPHSSYLKPEHFKELEISTSGHFGGLGMEVGMEDGYVKVISPIDDTPAYKAGIKEGDLIIKLDDKSVKGMTLTQAVDIMRGNIGDPIKLTIIREGSAQPIELNIKRDIIKVQSVKTKTLDDGYGYIRISQFQVDTGKELIQDLNKLKKDQNDNKLKGLILDLRNNPGGVLQAAVDVTDAFLKQGLIVFTKGRTDNSELRFNATKNDPSEGIPLIVLINSGSASASEIVAGALQDHKRAILLGSTSFGKGSVQTVIPLNVDPSRGLKLTTSLYYTPSGRSIQAEGIKPDIELPPVKVTLLKNLEKYKESDLKGHLNNGNDNKEPIKNDSENGDNDTKDLSATLLEQDYQLSQALNIIKGMHIKSQFYTQDKTDPINNDTK